MSGFGNFGFDDWDAYQSINTNPNASANQLNPMNPNNFNSMGMYGNNPNPSQNPFAPDATSHVCVIHLHYLLIYYIHVTQSLFLLIFFTFNLV